MPVPETCRKRKRKPNAYSNLQRFGDEGFPINRIGSFRDNIRAFPRDFSEAEECNVRGISLPEATIETSRKRKRKPELFNLQSFGEEGFPINRIGSFRDNIRVFLRDFAEVQECTVRGMPVWCTRLCHETKNIVIPLYTVEEDIIRSSEPYCDHCRCTGLFSVFLG